MGRSVRLSEAQKRELWDRWRGGETLVEIGRALGRSTPNVFTMLKARGGIAPAVRRRRQSGLRLEEREEISLGLAGGLSLHRIAARLGRAPSTISREVAHNGGREGYRAVSAEVRAWETALRPKPCLLAREPRLRDVVAEKLEQRWSPQQIAGWLRLKFGDDGAMRVSHETIYRSLFIQARGVLRRELLASLRSRRVMRRAHGARSQGMKRSLIPDAVSIRERPAEALDRAVPGHWEGDLLAGGGGSQIATLVERRSRFLLLARIGATKKTDEVVAALVRRVQTLPEQVKASLTWDRGSEMTAHARFTLATDIKVYFCDPHSPWQRGSNENTNGLLRQYLPKGCDLTAFSQQDLDDVALELNTRPRKTLDYKTPADIFNQGVAMTG
ncbi:MAG: IS30 family transposase [Caulobacter sp.]|nr:IS30 family transposase [Caulobacter sp.]